MRRFLVFFSTSLFASVASITLMTAAGLIATLIPAPPHIAIGICIFIAVIGIITIFFQMRLYWNKLAAEEQILERARVKFQAATESAKCALALIASETSASEDEIKEAASRAGLPPVAMAELEKTGFVERDWTLARYKLSPEYAQIIPQLVTEWRAMHGR